MSRRRRKNPLLARIITGTIIAHIIVLPIAAHFGAFDKLKKQFADAQVKLVPLPKQTKEKEQVKEKKAKAKPTKSTAKASSRHSGPVKADPNRQKVVADSSTNGSTSGDGPAIIQGTKTDAGTLPPPNSQSGGNKKGDDNAGGKDSTAPTKPPAPPPVVDRAPAPVKTEEVVKPKHTPVYAEPEQDYAPQPTIPDDLRNEPLEKNFVALFTVGPDGKPTDVKMIQSTGSSELDDIALKTAKQWRFKPATLDGTGTTSKVKLTIEFKVE